MCHPAGSTKPPGKSAGGAPSTRRSNVTFSYSKAEKSFSAKGASKDQARAAFEEKYPPGYFARREAFSRKGEYGSWLLEQPSVIKVNGVLFVHGGLTPEVAALGIDTINERVHKGILTFVESADLLSDDRLAMLPQENMEEQLNAIRFAVEVKVKE